MVRATGSWICFLCVSCSLKSLAESPSCSRLTWTRYAQGDVASYHSRQCPMLCLMLSTLVSAPHGSRAHILACFSIHLLAVLLLPSISVLLSPQPSAAISPPHLDHRHYVVVSSVLVVCIPRTFLTDCVISSAPPSLTTVSRPSTFCRAIPNRSTSSDTRWSSSFVLRSRGGGSFTSHPPPSAADGLSHSCPRCARRVVYRCRPCAKCL